MSDRGGFFQLILLSLGVIVVFTLIAYIPTLGIEGPWVGERSVITLIGPLILILCFVGFIAYVVSHR